MPTATATVSAATAIIGTTDGMTTDEAWSIVNRILGERAPIHNEVFLAYGEADELLRAFRALGMASGRSRSICGSGYDLEMRITSNPRNGKCNGWSASGFCPQWAVTEIDRLVRFATKCPGNVGRTVNMIFTIADRYRCSMVDDAALQAIEALERQRTAE
jgi:hypothetical protein